MKVLIMMRFFLKMMLVLTLSATAFADKKVVIIAGVGGLEKFEKRFFAQSSKLRKILINQYDYAPEDVRMLVEQAADSLSRYSNSNASTIRKTFQDLSKNTSAKDELIVFLLGHGTHDGEWAKFNIEGPDLRDIDFSGFLDGLNVGQLVFINMASASGSFLEKLSGDGRILISATNGAVEKNATRFAAHFIAALEKGNEADLNKDNTLSVTEAFIYARDNLIHDYQEKKQLRAEHPLLDDNGDGKGTETPDLLNGDGAIASRFNFMQERGGDVVERTAKAVPVSPELARKRKSVLDKIKKLQTRKEEMDQEEYYNDLEKLMLQLARINADSKK